MSGSGDSEVFDGCDDMVEVTCMVEGEATVELETTEESSGGNHLCQEKTLETYWRVKTEVNEVEGMQVTEVGATQVI
jgi:hypothetical protein